MFDVDVFVPRYLLYSSMGCLVNGDDARPSGRKTNAGRNAIKLRSKEAQQSLGRAAHSTRRRFDSSRKSIERPATARRLESARKHGFRN